MSWILALLAIAAFAAAWFAPNLPAMVAALLGALALLVAGCIEWLARRERERRP